MSPMAAVTESGVKVNPLFPTSIRMLAALVVATKAKSGSISIFETDTKVLNVVTEEKWMRWFEKVSKSSPQAPHPFLYIFVPTCEYICRQFLSLTQATAVSGKRYRLTVY